MRLKTSAFNSGLFTAQLYRSGFSPRSDNDSCDCLVLVSSPLVLNSKKRPEAARRLNKIGHEEPDEFGSPVCQTKGRYGD
ncbi:Uncharacterised protein [Vibrio cholerae]|nr:Uncharacterised protein [Vibrio cholerae]